MVFEHFIRTLRETIDASTYAIKHGKRAAQIVILVENVIGRHLSDDERNACKTFYDSVHFSNYSETTRNSDIMLDYFKFLLSDGESHPSVMVTTNMSESEKEKLIQCIEVALLRQSIPSDRKGFINDLSRHAPKDDRKH